MFNLLPFLKKEFVIYKSKMLATNIDFALQTSFTSNCFVLLIIFMFIVTTIYSIGYLIFERNNHKLKFHILTTISTIICIGLAYSANLFTAFIFYDLLSISTYILVRIHKDKNSEINAFIYAMYLIIPSTLFLLPAIICVYNIAEHTDFVIGGILSTHPISKFYINIMFLLFIYGISKTALYPLHKWLIHAMVAPSPVSALLHAVLVVKGGLFLLYKVIYEIFGLKFLSENIYKFHGIYWPIYIASISIILAALSANISENIKKRLAYSTISQIGYISLCLFCFSDEGILAAKMQFLAHSFAKISLFYYAGYLFVRYKCFDINELIHTRNHFNVFMSLIWLIPCFSLISMPLTIGYIGKHAIIVNSISSQKSIALLFVISIGMIICIAYLLPIMHHLASFNKEIRNKKFTRQYFSTFCIYFSATIISICIIFGYFFFYKIF